MEQVNSVVGRDAVQIGEKLGDASTRRRDLLDVCRADPPRFIVASSTRFKSEEDENLQGKKGCVFPVLLNPANDGIHRRSKIILFHPASSLTTTCRLLTEEIKHKIEEAKKQPWLPSSSWKMQCNGAGKPGVRCIVILNEARLATTQYLRCDGSNGSVAGADYSDKRPYILYYSVYDCTRLMLRCPAYNETLYCCV
uniref:Uncharacterized protein n=1 Tax=Vespula pensylvanica TaxID=30213 RepID=A0A834NZG4_VESPE|nr:hypothetical protein H0235_009888 [Vespula pensylvanica]